MNWIGGAFLALLCAAAAWLVFFLANSGISSSEVSEVKGDLALAKAAASFVVAGNPNVPSADGWTKILGNSLVAPSGDEVSPSSLGGDFLALYFSASWCPPCRKFLPTLKSFHESTSGRVQIVLMGQDQTAQSRAAYFEKSKMPWLSAPFESPLPDELASELGIRGIPALVVFDREGKIVTREGVMDVLKSPTKAVSEWSIR